MYFIKTMAILLISLSFTISSMAQGASLDISFGKGGRVNTIADGNLGEVRALELQSDGKIVVAGYASNGMSNVFAVARYHTNGNLDSSFGIDGIQKNSIGTEGSYAKALAIQKDGKILLAGTSGEWEKRKFTILRYDADGNLDKTFGVDGIVTTSVNLAADAHSLTIQSDGKIIVAGSAFNGSYNHFAVARYQTNGKLDSTFDADGILTTLVGSIGAGANAVALQADGKIVVTGYTYNDYDEIALARYNPDGSLDNSFDGDGKVNTDIGLYNEEANSLLIQPDGKIVIAGRGPNGTHNEFALIRYNTDGSLDNSFDSDGVVTTIINDGNEGAYDVALQPDGKLVIAGYSYNQESSQFVFAALRYYTDGNLDNSFGGNGKITTAIDSFNSFATSIAIQSDGKILTAGFSRMFPYLDKNSFSLVRYNPTSASIAQHQTTNAKINIYPNPFLTRTNLYLENAVNNGQLILQNGLGQTVQKMEHIFGKMIIVERGFLPAGHYTLQLTEEGQLIHTSKLVIAND